MAATDELSVDAPSLPRASIVYGAAYGVPALLALAVVPSLARSLGPAEFGVYGVCLSLHGILLTLSADPTTGALRRMYATARKAGHADAYVAAIYGLIAVLAVSVAVTATVVGLVGGAVTGGTAWVPRVAVVAAATAFFSVFQYSLATLYVRERVYATATAQVIHAVLKAGALVVGAIVAGTTVGAFAAYGVVLIGLSLTYVYRTLPRGHPIRDTAQWRRSLSYGVPLVAVSLSWVVLVGFDRTVLAVVSGDAAAGQYTAAYLVADFAVAAVGMVLYYASFPGLVRLWEAGRSDDVRATLLEAADTFLVVAAAVVVALVMAGSHVTAIIGGHGFGVPDAVPSLVGAGVLCFRMASFEATGFEFSMRSRALAGTFLITGAICVPLTIGAVVAFGLTGAALATFATFVAFWILVRRRNQLRDVTSYPLGRLARVLGAGIVAGACLWPLPWQLSFALALVLGPVLFACVIGRGRDLLGAVGSLQPGLRTRRGSKP